MRAFPRPPGFFHGRLECALIEAKVVVREPFAMYDGREWWSVPVGFPHDGASFPFWLRWIPALVAVLMMYLGQLDGAISLAEVWRSILWPAILQALVGYPLAESVREAAAVHDRGYWLGSRPKWKCDRAFFVALWVRIWMDLESGRIGIPKAWARLIQSAIWSAVVFLVGFGAWGAHRLRERRATS